MQLIKLPSLKMGRAQKIFLFYLFLYLFFVSSSFAQEKVKAKFRINYFTQSDGSNNKGGNPRIDEDLTVTEPILILKAVFNKKFSAKLKFVYDLIDTGNDPAVTSGASSKAKLDRIGSNLYGTYVFRQKGGNDSTIGAMIGYSSERDRYDSIQFGLNFSQEFLQKNLTYSMAFNLFQDTVNVIRYNNVNEGNKSKKTFNFSTSLSYIFTPQFSGDWFFNYTNQRGFLERPGNFVSIVSPSTLAELTKVNDVLPTSRDRFFTGLKSKYYFHFLDGAAVDFSYRYYFDNFDIKAHILSLFYFQHFGKQLVVRLRYRYYTQNASKYFFNTLTTLAKYRTQDPINSSFQSHTMGIQIVLTKLGFDVALDYYTRSDQISGLLLGVGGQWNF